MPITELFTVPPGWRPHWHLECWHKVVWSFDVGIFKLHHHGEALAALVELLRRYLHIFHFKFMNVSQNFIGFHKRVDPTSQKDGCSPELIFIWCWEAKKCSLVVSIFEPSNPHHTPAIYSPRPCPEVNRPHLIIQEGIL